MSSFCPICQKPTIEAHQPFCSARCRERDLHRWFSGQYAIPSEEPPEEEEMDQIISLLQDSLSGNGF